MSLVSFFGLTNFDLLATGITVAAIGIMGFVVFVENPSSATNKVFFLMALVAVAYAILNYASYQSRDPLVVLWLLRFVLFSAVFYSFLLFHLLYIIPKVKVKLPSLYSYAFVPFVFFVALLTLTPFVFSQITELAPIGQVTNPERGFGVVIFGITSVALVIGSFFIIIKKTIEAQGLEKKRLSFVLIGTIITYGLLILCNLILPVAFNNLTLIPYAPLFTLPFIVFTALSIIRYRFLEVKVIATEILSFVLAIVTFGQIIFSETLIEKIFTTGIFILVLVFSVLLIRSVIREVRQREEIQLLAENLKQANEKLKELDKLKSQFLSIASHDLKAPLTIVRNFLSLLLEGTYGKLVPAAEEGLQQVFDRATDMTKSVDTYLNVSRIEQGSMKYDFINVELTPILKKSFADFKPNADQKGITLKLSIAPELEGKKAKLDVAKINEVLNNLLDNSIKYTPKGSITVSAVKEGNVARIILKDTGIGMSQATIAKLFQLFSTADDSRKTNVNSTGVGLYITKAHILAHKGTIWAESDGEGKGSRFILELPLLT